MIVLGTFDCGNCHIMIRTGYDPKQPVVCPSCGTVLYEGQSIQVVKSEPPKQRQFFRKQP